MNRRSFIEKTSLSTVAMISAFNIPSFSQSKKLKIGLIGCGWYGMVITNAALKVGGVEVIGICDVDTAHLKDSADELEKLQGSRPKEFKDYQDLLDQKGLEALLAHHLIGMHFSLLLPAKRGSIFIARSRWLMM